MSDRSPQSVFEGLLREAAAARGLDVRRGEGLVWACGWRERFDVVLARFAETFVDKR